MAMGCCRSIGVAPRSRGRLPVFRPGFALRGMLLLMRAQAQDAAGGAARKLVYSSRHSRDNLFGGGCGGGVAALSSVIVQLVIVGLGSYRWLCVWLDGIQL
jgi:hypothetical protein